jgi:hypothetical protein
VFVGNVLASQRTLLEGPFEETIVSKFGELVVRYDQERVRVLDATCKHKTCVEAGSVSRAGESLVCIPGRIRVVLAGAGDSEREVHAVSQ